jgi:hypothetical protein
MVDICLFCQQMLVHYNRESASPSYDNSWTHSADLLNPTKDSNDDHFISDIPSSMSLPRAKVATVQRQTTSTMFHSRNSLRPPSEHLDQPYQLPINEYDEDFRCNIPLQERFHHKKPTNIEELE